MEHTGFCGTRSRQERIMRGKQKKIAVFNDLTGFGRCALAVQMPVISALKVQCCPVPTAIFSNHTAYPEFFFDDYTEKIPAYTEKWKKLELEFDGILTGFLGSQEQFDAVEAFIQEFQKETLLIVDPVMGDNGKCYATYTPDMCVRMRRLASRADLITPNLTECCILSEREYRDNLAEEDIEEMAGELIRRGTKNVVVTGVIRENRICNYIAGEKGNKAWVQTPRQGAVRCGTGDIFSAVLSAELVKGTELERAVKKAARFVGLCLEASERLEIPRNDGLAFEEVLDLISDL